MKLSAAKISLFCLLLPAFTLGATCAGIQSTTVWRQRTVNSSASVRPVAVAVRDLDGDNLPDIVAAYAGTTTVTPAVFIFFQTTVDAFVAVQAASTSDLSGVAAIAVDDIDLDTHADIVAACNGRIVYLHSPADPRQAAGWTHSTIAQSDDAGFAQWNDIAIGDIDGANGLDIVACNGSSTTGRLSWFQSPASPTTGTGWVRVDIDAATRLNATGVALDDIDGDARLDVFSTAPGEAAARVAWYRNPANPATDAWAKTTIGNEASAARLVVADLNGDTRNDLVVSFPASRRIGWYVKPVDPTTAWSGYTLTQYSSSTPTDVKAADLDGNGQIDVVVGTQTAGSLRWFSPLGAQTLQWLENNVKNLNEAVGRIALGDIDRDGRTDVVVPLQAAATSGDSIAWFENPEP
jgi:hypothetical protein